MNTDELIKAVVDWGREKGLDDPNKQSMKLGEEYGELLHELCRGHYQSVETKDALGDISVVLIILADILGYDFVECLNDAYNVIRDRKGTTVLGSFVKEE